MATFTLMSLNVRHGQGPVRRRGEKEIRIWYPPSRMKEHAERLADFIRSRSPAPDVICLQEARALAPWWSDVASVIRERIGYVYCAPHLRRAPEHDNVILSRLPIREIRSGRFHLSFSKGFVACDIEGAGWVCATHLACHTARNARLAQAAELQRFLELLRDERGGNLVLAGDLNIWPPDDPALKVLTKAGEKERLYTIPPPIEEHYASCATWPAGPSLHSGITPEIRLDYIFVSPPRRMLSCTRLFTGLTDHYGLLAVIE